MQPDVFDSSDSQRHARTLKFAQSVTFERPVLLEHGAMLPQVTVAYETYGQLSARRDNAILICHALSGDSHVARHDDEDDPGWWDVIVGPGKPIDTSRYFVICPNILGGCRGTTGPNSVNPLTGRRYGPDFPVVTVGDIVEVQRWLVDHLGIEQLLAVVGGSLGGHMTLYWATKLPDRVRGAIALATSPRLTSQALAFDIIGRNAILRDPNYHGGHYYDQPAGPQVGLAIARMLGHITYLSREAMMAKFDAERLRPREIQTQFETKFAVGSYLAYQGDRFGERFDANSYLTLTMALDLFDLGNSVEALREPLRASLCKWLVLSYTSDWLFPPFQSQQIVDALLAENKPVSYCNIESSCGHDAFLLANDADRYGEMIRAFLVCLQEEGRPAAGRAASAEAPPIVAPPVAVGAGAELNPAAAPTTTALVPLRDDPVHHIPTSIYHRRHRLDYDSIAGLIPPGASVLDLGCGTGGLLERLRRRDHHRLMGVERDEYALLECIRRGLNVVQADINAGLAAFADKQFDFVVLSRTLQTVTDVELVIREMLRVGTRAIVSFPNIAHRRLRRQLAEEGRAPRVEAEEGFHWYNTPNVRFLSIADFEDFCREKNYRILHHIPLDTEAGWTVADDPNLNADVAVMVLGESA